MRTKRQINGRHVVNDLRSGMGDVELQSKYELSPKTLQSILERLVAYNAISHSELCERSTLYRETADPTRLRKFRRLDLNIPVVIHDVDASGTGLLKDISENGLRVEGIGADVGQLKTFQIPLDVFIPTDPLLVVAECKWVGTKRGGESPPEAGFRMMDLSDTQRKAIKNFMGLLVLGESGEWRTVG